MMKNIMSMIMNLVKIFMKKKIEKKRGIQYAILIAIVFILSHYMTIKYVEEPSDYSLPYIEKKIIYPELYKDKER